MRVFSMGLAPMANSWTDELYFQMLVEGGAAVDGIITAGANRTWFSKFSLYQSADVAAGGDYTHPSWYRVTGPNNDGSFPANSNSTSWVTNAIVNVQSAVYILLVSETDVTGMDVTVSDETGEEQVDRTIMAASPSRGGM